MNPRNRRTEANATQRYRWANGGNTVLSRYGRDYLAGLSRGNGLNVYGSDAGARRVRASDMARRKALSDPEWALLLRKRELQFGLAPGTLTPVAPAVESPS